jgi:hypothetical protein
MKMILTFILALSLSLCLVSAANLGYTNSNFPRLVSTPATTTSPSSSNLSGNCPGGYVVQNISSGVLQCVPNGNGSVSVGGSSYNVTYDLWSYNQTTPAQQFFIDNEHYVQYVSVYNTSEFLNVTIGRSGWQDETGSFNMSLFSFLWDSMFNSTYQLWAYNQTTPANLYTDNKVFPIFNNTYQLWSYNQTTPAITYASTYAYNETAICIAYSNNQGWNSTFNSTYQTWAYNQSAVLVNIFGQYWSNHSLTLINQFGTQWYNHTITSKTYTDSVVTLMNNTWSSTFNSTYQTWAYNMTVAGIGDGSYNITYANAISNLTQYLFLSVATQTNTNQTTGNWNMSIFNFSMLASTSYVLECNMIGSSATTTTGLQLNLSMGATPTYFATTINNPTTATAPSTVACYGTMTACAILQATSVAAGVPITINSRIENGATAQALDLTMRSEINTMVVLQRGSYCRLTKV